VNNLDEPIIKKNNKIYKIVRKIYYSFRNFLTYNYKFYINKAIYLLFFKNKSIKNINNFEKRVYSQNGEDGIIEIIFDKIGTTNKYFVEFGVEDGRECNTKNLRENFGWKGLMMDGNGYNNPLIKKEFITAENINHLFKKYNVPINFDLLSIDIDFNDYYVWRAIKKYNPRVVLIEYNSSIPYNLSKVVKYEPLRMWDGTNYFGASIKTLYLLGKSKGYALIACDSNGSNAFFIKKELIKNNFLNKKLKDIYKPPNWGKKMNGKKIGHPKSKEKMLKVYK
jgi:hypothetical protein